MSYYVTKYALSSGILELNRRDFKRTDTDGIYGKRGDGYFSEHFHGKDFHETKEDAIARAEEMRKAKIASLKKSIAKLEKLKF